MWQSGAVPEGPADPTEKKGVPVEFPIAALVPLVLAALAWIAYCLVDLSRSEVRYLPKWAWGLFVVLSVPIGGIVYLIVGREPR
jgi:hypothetical protein